MMHDMCVTWKVYLKIILELKTGFKSQISGFGIDLLDVK